MRWTGFLGSSFGKLSFISDCDESFSKVHTDLFTLPLCLELRFRGKNAREPILIVNQKIAYVAFVITNRVEALQTFGET